MSAFWIYSEGGKSGIKHPVKNLRWIINHKKEVESLSISKSLATGAHFHARLDNGKMYYCRFDSFTVAKDFILHKRFAHVQIKQIIGE